jgi:hypothetical protein
MVSAVEARLETHEAVCAERYSSIELQFRSTNARLKRIESLMIAAATGVIGGFASIIMLLLQMR